jgi:hypothetical protein
LESAREAIEIKAGEKPNQLGSKGLVPNVLCYDRHKPLPNADIGYVGDLGVILKERFGGTAEFQPLIVELRKFFKEHEHSTARLGELLSGGELSELLQRNDLPAGIGKPLISLVLFLRWKHQAQRSGSVSCDLMMDDLRQCSGRVQKSVLEQAVWLFGAYCGFDKIAGEVYARRPGDFPFVSSTMSHQACELIDPPPRPVIEKQVAAPALAKESACEGAGLSAVAVETKATEDSSKAKEDKLKEDGSRPASPAPTGVGDKESGGRKDRKRRVKGHLNADPAKQTPDHSASALQFSGTKPHDS